MKKMVICMSLLLGQAWGLGCVQLEEHEAKVLCPSQDSNDDDDDDTVIV